MPVTPPEGVAVHMYKVLGTFDPSCISVASPEQMEGLEFEIVIVGTGLTVT